MHYSERERQFINEFRALCHKHQLVLHPTEDGFYDFNDVTKYHPQVEILIGIPPYVPGRFKLYLQAKETK